MHHLVPAQQFTLHFIVWFIDYMFEILLSKNQSAHNYRESDLVSVPDILYTRRLYIIIIKSVLKSTKICFYADVRKWNIKYLSIFGIKVEWLAKRVNFS